jgi:hypothetical protein
VKLEHLLEPLDLVFRLAQMRLSVAFSIMYAFTIFRAKSRSD